MSSGYLKSSWNESGLDLELFDFLDFLDFFIFEEDAAPTGPNAARNASNEMELYFIVAMVNIA